MILKRKFILTYDDIFCVVIFMTSFCLYWTYESPSAQRNSRHAIPFLHQEPGVNRQPAVQPSALSDEERLRLLFKNTSAQQILKEIDLHNHRIANSRNPMTKQEIKKRRAFLEDELNKRR